MDVQRFEAANMPSGVAMVKAALGPDAIILTSRYLPSKGLLGKKRVELTAMLEPEQGLDVEGGPDSRDMEVPGMNASLHALLADSTLQTGASGLGQSRDSMAGMTASDLRELLQRLDIHPQVAQAITVGTSGSKLPRRRQLEIVLRQELKELSLKRGNRVLALVGPTGVGKTTTVAKLAARWALQDGKRVVVICADSYRIGAVEQLAHYAELIDCPIEIARNNSGLRRAIARHQDADAIIIDTAGRSPSDHDALRATAALLDGIDSSVLLTLTAHMRWLECDLSLSQHAALNPKGLIFTKVDEAAVPSAIINVAHASQLPVACITDGQRVPEDIRLANSAELAHLVANALLTHADALQARTSANRYMEA